MWTMDWACKRRLDCITGTDRLVPSVSVAGSVEEKASCSRPE